MSTVQTQTPSAAQAATPTEAVIGVKQLTTLLESMLRTAEKYSGEIELLPRGIEFKNFEGMCRWARYSAASGLAPKGMEKFETCLVAIVIGRAVGLDPFQAVQSIAVVDNRPFLCGDAPLAIARQHQAWDESGYEEYFEVDGKPVVGAPDPDAFQKSSTACVCKTLRKGQKTAVVRRFSIAHARAGGLLDKAGGLAAGSSQRLLRLRARGECIRDNFGDALKGLGIRELDDHAKANEPLSLPTRRQTLGNRNGVSSTHEEEQQAPSMEWYAVDPPAQEEHPIRQLDEAEGPRRQSEDDWQITANEIATDLNDTDDQADLNAPFTARHAELAPAPRSAPKQPEEIWPVPKGVRSRK